MRTTFGGINRSRQVSAWINAVLSDADALVGNNVATVLHFWWTTLYFGWLESEANFHGKSLERVFRQTQVPGPGS